jgi:NitT/TauT family transport system ATP-binding protein
MENNLALKISHLYHSFPEEDGRKLEVIKDISFEVQKGEFLSIVGPSGGGKSTLLRIIAGLVKPTSGLLELGSGKIAMVFQNFAIFPWLTAYENIEFGLKMSGIIVRERKRIAHEKIKEVGLSGFENKYPKELSGGMRQRVGIARALAVNPEILLIDEPFSSLDAFTAEKLRNDLLAIWLQYKMTVVLVTHLVEEAVQLSDRVLVLSPRPAKIKLELAIPLKHPRDKRSQEFYALVDKIIAEIEQ